ncbi:MAG: hypothetical protein MJA83_17420 [Gammaproteobacteria bacterium]|nr:hypothetical protein [Gammaproteobacteria bacterium]
MTVAKAREFLADMLSEQVLLDEYVEAVKASNDEAAALSAFVALGARRGYVFSNDDALQAHRDLAEKIAAEELPDSALDLIAGGTTRPGITDSSLNLVWRTLFKRNIY